MRRFLNSITPRKAFLSTTALFLILLVTNGVAYIYSDGYCYYHVSRSILDQGNFVSTDLPEYYDYRSHNISEFAGKYVTVCAPGNGIFNLPWLFAEKLLTGDKTVYNDYFKAFNGHTITAGLAILSANVVFALITIYLLYKILRELNYSPKLSMLATAASYASFYTIWYVLLYPSWTHTYELFTIVLAIWSVLRFNATGKYRYLVLAGASIGMATLIRQVVGIIAVALIALLWQRGKLKGVLTYTAGGIPFAVILMAYNFVSYGKILASGYSEVRSEGFDFTAFNQLNVLFSPQRGLFVYTPIALIGLVGLVVLYRRNKKLSAISLSVFAAWIVVYGFWTTWWSGGGYGNRFLIDLMPFIAIGVAEIINLAKWKSVQWKTRISITNLMLGLISICVLWSLLITVMYRFTPVETLRPISDNVGNMYAFDRYTPLDMINYQIGLASKSKSPQAYAANLFGSISGGRSLLAIAIGLSDPVIKLDDRVTGILQFNVIYPPVLRQSVPSEINGYLFDKRQNTMYEFKFSNIKREQVFTINCQQLECAAGTDVTLTKLPVVIKNFPRKQYFAYTTHDANFQLYQVKADNILIKAPVILTEETATDYQLD
jgi:hypothetical protein